MHGDFSSVVKWIQYNETVVWYFSPIISVNIIMHIYICYISHGKAEKCGIHFGQNFLNNEK